jgi:hypothetical protein
VSAPNPGGQGITGKSKFSANLPLCFYLQEEAIRHCKKIGSYLFYIPSSIYKSGGKK